MTAHIEWVRGSCRLLAAIAAEFTDTRPFAGMVIGTGIHLEPKTAALLLTLARGGAEVISTGNLSSTQSEVAGYLRDRGVHVIGDVTTDEGQHSQNLRQVVAARPNLILDNGADLFMAYLTDPYPTLLGGTEETTSGRIRLHPLAGQFNMPILVINDSPIKQFAENRHAVGQSVLESFQRITNRIVNGRRVAVFGYGACGKGIAAAFRNSYAVVSVIDTDVVARLEASFDGFKAQPRSQALSNADIVVTATGAEHVIGEADIDLFKNEVILCNAGHFPKEIAVHQLLASPRVVRQEQTSADIATLHTDDGRRIHLLADGHMVNLAGSRPLGNSIESMDLGFALQARCLEAIATGLVGEQDVIVPVPAFIDEAVAAAFLELYDR